MSPRTCRQAAGRAPGRGSGDDGAAVVEFALVLPFLALVLFGLLEFGNLFRQKTLLESTVASAARVDVQIGTGRFADFEALRAVSSGLSSSKGTTIQRVVVWKATADSAGPKCTTGGSVDGVCNVYSAAQVADSSGSGFPGGVSTDSSCPAGSWDKAWCPTQREDGDRIQDYLGVYVEVRQPMLSHVFSADMTMSSWAVYRIEPPLGAR